MIRSTLLLVLGACLLLAVSSFGVADEGDGEGFLVQIHDVSDLAEAYPWLAEVLRTSIAGAQITPHGERTLIVRADASTHRALERVLTWLRQHAAGGMTAEALEGATRLRARLATHRVSSKVDDAPLSDFLGLLAKQHEIPFKIATKATPLLEGRTISLHVEDEPLDSVLGLIATLVPIRWQIVDGHAVEILPNFNTQRAELTLEFGETDVELVDKLALFEWENDVDRRLHDAVKALREEVRALRTEIAEIKALLEKRRAR